MTFSRLSPAENLTVRDLKPYVIACETCKLDLADTKVALQACLNNPCPELKPWQETSFVVMGVMASFLLGFAIGNIAK